MSRRPLVLASVAAALLFADSAPADSSQSVTATGNGVVKVRPKNRHREAPIEAAVEAARKAGIKLAIVDARQRALAYAHAAGLTLGTVIAVSDVQSNGFYGVGLWGPFGPNQFCGNAPQPPIAVFGAAVRGRKRVKRVRHCYVPPFEDTTLTVTFSAGQPASGQAKSVTATGSGVHAVRPRNRHSNASILAAVRAAQTAGIALAVSDANEYALAYAHAAGLTLGAATAVSDAQSSGYGPGFDAPFGPGRYCGRIARPIIKIVGHRRKVTGVKRVHVCVVPPVEVTTLTVTYSAT